MPAAESYLSKNMSLSLYVSTSFLFHSGLTDIQFQHCTLLHVPRLVTVWFPTLDIAIVQYEYPGKNNVFSS